MSDLPGTARKKIAKDLAIVVRREDDGKVFSEIRDRNADPYLSRADGVTIAVTIDRQRGRGLDLDTICNRARYLSELLDLPYEEDLRHICLAAKGSFCTCPDCITRTKAGRRG